MTTKIPLIQRQKPEPIRYNYYVIIILLIGLVNVFLGSPVMYIVVSKEAGYMWIVVSTVFTVVLMSVLGWKVYNQ